MRIDPAELNKRISIYIADETGADKDGFPVIDKTLIRKCWAKVSNTSGTELVKANANFAETKKRFLVRHNSQKPIDTDMIVLYKGDFYDIKYINNYDEKDKYDEIWGELRELV